MFTHLTDFDVEKVVEIKEADMGTRTINKLNCFLGSGLSAATKLHLMTTRRHFINANFDSSQSAVIMIQY